MGTNLRWSALHYVCGRLSYVLVLRTGHLCRCCTRDAWGGAIVPHQAGCEQVATIGLVGRHQHTHPWLDVQAARSKANRTTRKHVMTVNAHKTNRKNKQHQNRNENDEQNNHRPTHAPTPQPHPAPTPPHRHPQTHPPSLPPHTTPPSISPNHPTTHPPCFPQPPLFPQSFQASRPIHPLPPPTHPWPLPTHPATRPHISPPARPPQSTHRKTNNQHPEVFSTGCRSCCSTGGC